MPKHTEKRLVDFPAEKMYDLVADVESYPEFLPWCVECAKLPGGNKERFRADLIIGWKLIHETFRSQVSLKPSSEIYVELIEGPFTHLYNKWEFVPRGDGICEIRFSIDFEFNSTFLRSVMQPLFHKATQKMIAAFEARAQEVYGK